MFQQTKNVVACFALVIQLAGNAFSGQTRGQPSHETERSRGAESVLDLRQTLTGLDEAPETPDKVPLPLRFERRRLYNRPAGTPFQKELPPGVEPNAAINHWDSGLPALPIPQSGTIVIASVEGAKTFLSADKHYCFSEFELTIEEILVNRSQASVVQGHSIAVNRAGGAIRFPSGRVMRLRIYQQGFPMVGGRYLFFLRAQPTAGSFEIITGYQLNEGKAWPLDGVGFGSQVRSQFDKYSGVEEATFVALVRQAISEESAKPKQ